MEGELSIGAVVQTIMESLSDAISQLILMVIALQEKNAVVPPHVPTAAAGVATACNTLVQVARGLAADEYVDFPDIQEPIYACATDVEAASQGLLDSVEFISTSPDRVAGWDRLLASCRTISFETVRILQIVYGAELKRLMMAIENARNATKINPDLAAKNPEEFVRQVDKLSQNAADLAEYVRAKANDEDSPVLKKLFNDLGDSLQRDADQVVQRANDLLKNPKDDKLQKEFANVVRNIENAANQAAKPVQEKIQQLPDSDDIRKLFEGPKVPAPGPSGRVPSNPSERSKGAPGSGPARQSRRNKPMPPAIEKARDMVRQIAEAAHAGDPGPVQTQGAALPPAIAQIVNDLEREAARAPDQERRGQLQAAAADLREAVPPFLGAANDALKDRGDKPKRALDGARKAIEAALESAGTAIRPAPDVDAAALLQKLKDDALDTVRAAEDNNRPALDNSTKQIQDAKPAIAPAVRDFANRISNPKRKEHVAGLVDKVNPAIDAVTAAAKEVAARPADAKAKDKLDSAAHNLARLVDDILGNGLAPLAADRKQEDDLARLAAVAQGDAPQKIADVMRKIVARHPDLGNEVQDAIIRSDDPKTRDRLQKAWDRMDALMPETIRDAEDIVTHPGDARPKEKLWDDVDKMIDLLDEVAEAMKAAPPLPPRDRTRDVPLPSVQQLLPELFAAAEAAKDSPADPKKKQRLEKALNAVLAASGDDTWNGEPDADDIIAGLIDAQEAALQEMMAAAEEGKPDVVDKIAKDVLDRNKDLVARAKEANKEEPEPEKKEMMQDAVGDIESQVPAVVAAAKELAKRPGDKKAKEQVQQAAKPAIKNLKYVREAKKPNDLVAARNAGRNFKIVKGKGLPLDNKNPDELAGALGRLKKTARDLNGPGNGDGPNWLAGRDVAGAIADLEKRLAGKGKRPEEEMKTPGFKDAMDKFQKAVDRLKEDPRAELAGDLHDMAQAVDRLDASLDKGPGKPAVTAMKQVAGKKDPIIKRAKDIADRTADPEKKKRIIDAIKRLEDLVPKEVDAVKKFIQEPTQENKEEAQTIGHEIKEALATIGAAALDTPEARIDDLIAKEKAAVARLNKTAKRPEGKAREIEDLSKVAQDTRNKLADLARDLGKSAPQLKDDLAHSLADVDKELGRVIPAAKDLGAGRNKEAALAQLEQSYPAVDPALDRLAEDLKEALKAGAGEVPHDRKTRQLIASLKTKGIKKLDPRDLIAASRRLAGLLNDLVGKTKLGAQALPLSERGKAALDLDDLLVSLESAANKAGKGGIDSSISSLQRVALSGSAASPAFDTSSVLQSSIARVVKEIQQRNVGIEDTLSNLSLSLAAELQKLSDADRTGSRQDLVVTGRAIAAIINKYCEELRKVASACRDPVLQDKLMRNAQALKNYGTQVKIMASVRAASQGSAPSFVHEKGKQGSHTDQLLADLAQNLGVLISENSTTVSTIRSSKRF
eukprot:TRINITY_DN475_c0_g1_i1.p1 TRINITY_DN475_c0_g1~~TRINITY_DN475_c0_g1_i1.p1  ORF type:complete len:1458 (+),score=534.71 TRINITY_DN475_c0_g1_i1:108-4481(+)